MSSESVFRLFRMVFKDDVRFKIIEVLACREAVNLRALSRAVGMHHKNVRRYLDELVEKGVVKSVQVSSATVVYRLNDDYNFLMELFRSA